MPDDPRSGPWTLPALKEHVDVQLRCVKDEFEREILNIKESIRIALAAKGEDRKDTQWNIGTIIASLLALGAIVIAFLKH